MFMYLIIWGFRFFFQYELQFFPLFLDGMWYAQTLRAVDELVGAPTEVFIVSFIVNADWPVMPWVGERGER